MTNLSLESDLLLVPKEVAHKLSLANPSAHQTLAEHKTTDWGNCPDIPFCNYGLPQ